jgi:hypothetical protein
MVREERTVRPRWIAALLLLALVPSAQLAWQFRDMPHFGRQNDDGIYFVCAKSLAEGAGYRIQSLPGTPFQTKYPPVLPLYLSIAWKLNPEFPANLPLATLLCWLLLPVLAFLAWLTYRDLGYAAAASGLLAAAFIVNPYSALFAISPLSEVLSAIALLGCLLAARKPRWAPVAGALAGLAFLVKTAFLPLLPAVAAFYLIRRQWRAAALFLCCALPPVLGWAAWSAAHRATPSPLTLFYTDYIGFYLDNFSWSTLPTLLSNNIEVLFGGVAALVVFGSEHSSLPMHLFRLIAIASIAGVIRQARRTGLAPYQLFAIGYLPVLIAWNYSPHQRFVYPVYPLLLGGLATELGHLVGMVRGAWRKQKAMAAVLALLIAMFCGYAAYSNWFGLYRHLPMVLRHDRNVRPSLLQAYAWIREHVPAEARFLAYDDPSLYLHTGRKACGLHAPTRLYYEKDVDVARSYFGTMPELARQGGYDSILLTGVDFLQDLSQEDRRAARREIDEYPHATTLYDRDGVAVRSILVVASLSREVEFGR